MIFSYFPTKDNTITNATINGTAKTGSNQGRSEVLDLFYLPQASSSVSYGKSRILLQFDVSQLSSSVASGLIPSSSVEYRLKLKSAEHSESLPESFDIEICPVSRSWDEGSGLSNYDEQLKHSGFSNWNNATSIQTWSLTGSDFLTTVTASQHFDTGEEDLDVDISSIVYAWLTGGLVNNGLVLKYPSVYENGNNELFIKKFFSRHSHVPERIPRLEARWDNTVYQDDRNNVAYSKSSNLFYYRSINGQYENASNELFVNIVNSSGTVFQTLTASLKETGVYCASGVLLNFTSSVRTYNDVWFSGSSQYYTGSFSPFFSTGSNSLQIGDLVVNITNLKSQYFQDENAFIRVFARPKDYKPAIKKSGSLDVYPIYLRDSYYEISNAETEEVLVPFSTGSNKFTKLSYDKDGNYFRFNFQNLPKYGLYKIRILVNYNSEKNIFDGNWLIKIV